MIEFGVEPGDTVGAAVSGGVDSMVLLDVLCKLREELNIIIVGFHFEHGIRAAASVEDMRFVQRECQSRGVTCVVGREDVVKRAREESVSIETAARHARYAYLDAQPAKMIATAHHAGDMAETVLMNLCRGSGLAGLCGIPERRGRYVRPLLEITRDEIERYASENGVGHVYDSTNDDTVYTRNYVRAEVLPRLKNVNAQALEHIARTARLLAEDEAALAEAAQNAGGIEPTKGGVSIDIDTLMRQNAAIRKRMIRLAVRRHCGLEDLSQGHVNAIMVLAEKGISGKFVELPGVTVAAVEYGKLSIGNKKEEKYNYTSIDFHGEGRYALENTVFWCESGAKMIRRSQTECFDIDSLYGVCFRHRREGDYICPLGMRGKKRLSDYLSDRKVPLMRRDSLVVLARGSEVVWAVGVGVSETTKVKEHSPCFIIKYEER